MVHKGLDGVGMAVLFVLMLTLLYPAIFLGQRVAPEAGLHSAPPWRLQWGPHPDPPPTALRTARVLGPRLASIARDGFAVAVWNPCIGGGRPGWLSAPSEGGTPPVVAAALLAAPGFGYTGLLALEILIAFSAVFLLTRGLGMHPWAAAAGGLGYALSGAVTAVLFESSGAAIALGPAATLPVLYPARTWSGRTAQWGAVCFLLLACGREALPFVAMGIAMLATRSTRWRAAPFAAMALGLLLAITALTPRLWLSGQAAEPDAPPAVRPIEESVPSPASFLRTSGREASLASALQADPPSSAQRAFLGLPLVLLACLGIAAPRSTDRWLWMAALGSTLVLGFLDGGALRGLGLAQRPLGLLALATAVLAAQGADLLIRRVPEDAWQAIVGIMLCVLIGARLLPPAARLLPYAPGAEGELPSPLPTSIGADGSRVAALLAAMPPDVAATLGIPDARAGDLTREPRYAAMLAAEDGGLLPVTRALDPSLTRLGVRWLLEPLPLRVVSGEIFARVEADTARRAAPGSTAYVLEPPPGARTVGIATAELGDAQPLMVHGDEVLPLGEDTALAGESSDWRWFGMPSAERPLPTTIRLPGDGPRPANLSVAWDTSGVGLVGESLGVRIWELEHARPFLTAEQGLSAPRLLGLTPTRVDAECEAPTPSRVLILVKYRPNLWRATIDGEATRVSRAEEVWCAVEVPAGIHRLILEAKLPLAVWLLATLGITGILALATVGRFH